MSDLHLGADFTIDANIATKRTLLLGQPESGKTNGATAIGEELLKLGVPVTVLDWKGDLWGMRSSADGQSEGFPVVIFGGDHADVEVTDHDGREIGHLVAKDEMPSVIDLSGFATDAERRRFFTAFLKAFLHAKKDAVRPHTLLIDEYQQFAPQRPYGEGIQLLGATEQVVGLGRKRGIGLIGTALRAAQLNKNVVEISDLYLFMQVAGRNDLKSITETLQSVASAEELKLIRETIPRLGKGGVVAYSPAWLRILEEHRFRLRETFDSSRTPQVGDTLTRVSPRAFAKIDVPSIAARIEATREKREAEDPETLRATIADLRRQLAARPTETVEVEVERIVEMPILTADDRHLLQTVVGALGTWGAAIDLARSNFDDAKNALAGVDGLVERIDDQLSQDRPKALERRAEPVGVPQTVPTRTSGTESPVRRSAEGSNEPSKITPACLRILVALKQRDPKPLSRRALGFLCGQSPKSSSYTNNLAWLNARGYIRRVADGALALTTQGAPFVSHITQKTTSAAVQAEWLPRFAPAQRRILEALVAAWPNVIERDKLAKIAGASPTSSSYSNNLAALNSIGVIERVEGGIRASNDLFPTGKPR